MNVRELVHAFYGRLWNEIDLGVADEILSSDVTFRGSVGTGANGRDQVRDYVLMITSALSQYRCDIERLVVEGDQASAKVRFSGLHTGTFLGFAPTGRRVEWHGVAMFTERQGKLEDIWVMGDVEGLRAQLSGNV